MKLNELTNVENIPGIYLIRNLINQKCYIGQTIRLKTRLQDHYSTAISKKCNNQKQRMILYKAIEKYGIDNFDYQILFSEQTNEFNSIKSKLDELEKKYIVEYNSYVPNGYNQTKGGDAGILGFKMTQDQKNLVSQQARLAGMDGRNMIYCYDIVDKYYYTSVSLPCLAKILNIKLDTSQIRYNLTNGRYVIARTKEVLQEKIEKVKKAKTRYCKENVILDLQNGIKALEFCRKYNVCRKTFYNYKRKFLNRTI